MLDEYKSDNLFLVIGNNPLPNYVAIRLLSHKDTKYHFIYTTETYQIVEKLINVLKIDNNNINRIIVDQSNTCEIYSKVVKAAKDKLKVCLHYTSGTKTMSLHAYRAIYDTVNNSENDPIFSYLDAQTLELLIERTNNSLLTFKVGLLINPPPTITDLMALHGLSPRSLNTDIFRVDVCTQLLKVDRNEMRDWCDINLKKPNGRFKSVTDLSQVVLPIHNTFTKMIPFWENCANLGELSQKWNKNVTFIAEYLDGKWLEHYVFSQLEQIAKQCNIQEMVLSLIPNEQAFEIDIVALKGYQLIAISCTTSYRKGLLKEKLFEAFIRGRQLGGDEAKIGLVCFINENDDFTAQQIKEEINVAWNLRNKFAVFGYEDLEYLSQNLKNWFDSF